jgi:hypothetical protein
MSRPTRPIDGQVDAPARPADFSQAGYRALLRSFRSAGYRSADFESVAARETQLLLRHDVDLSLDEAVKIAEIDASESWRATVFVLVATEFYNVFTHAGRASVLKIISLGHEIGLHFDGSVHNDGRPPTEFTPELEAAAERECEMLERLIGAPIKIIAFHRPRQSSWVIRRSGRFANRLQAYAPEFMSDIAYVADSAGHWSEGHPLDHPAFQQRLAMQVNMHPYLWTQPAGLDRVQKIDSVREARAQFLEREARRNFSFYPR